MTTVRANDDLFRRLLLGFVALLLACAADGLAGADRAWSQSLKAIDVPADVDSIEINPMGRLYEGRGDLLQVETAVGADGIAGRMAVKAKAAGTNPSWMVFALRNPTNRVIERWIVADRYRLSGSGIIWPDLDTVRIKGVTPSLGFVPEQVANDRADIFRVTLEPGQSITYAVEFATDRPARLQLWKALEYEQRTRDRQLFNGIMLGLMGLLGIFLTAIFVANHRVIFPFAALFAWCVLGFLCVDFGFWHKLFQSNAGSYAQYRAAAEASVAASFLLFMYVFLRIRHWHGFIHTLFAIWIIAQIGLISIAVLDPRLAATFARLSFAAIFAIGAIVILFLSLKRQDRALSLLPTWIFYGVWLFSAALVATGRITGDVPELALVAGLVFILLIVGFTVTQFAFRAAAPIYEGAPSELHLHAQAVENSGSAVWEWNGRRDEVRVGHIAEVALGLAQGDLSRKLDDFIDFVHPGDRDRFRLALKSLEEEAQGGDVQLDIRLRHADNSYRWFELEASAIPSTDRRHVRCLGLIRDVTNARRAQERLLHDAVHDSLTGLPNRELFIDRLAMALKRAPLETHIRPTVLFIDVDKFKSVNSSFGLVVGDSLLIAVARRLARHLDPQDTLARIGGDQFAILVSEARPLQQMNMLADRIRHALKAPIQLAGQEIMLTGSVGIAYFGQSLTEAHELLRAAEMAMYRAKRGGSDRVEIYKPEMAKDRDDRITVETELRRALERRQLKVLYQPIYTLSTEDLVGFEALVRWDHPKYGLLNPSSFVPVAEETDLIIRIGSYVLEAAMTEVVKWQRELPRPDNPLFVSVNVSTRQLFRQDLVQEVKHVLSRKARPEATLRLEITESLVMENPEQAVSILQALKAAGADIALDDFGAGYSSLSYLQAFPVDTIKIDRALVQSSSDNGPGSVIVRSIVAMARELGHKVIAEGIETIEDLAFLRSTGCEYGQGFYFGEPMSEREALAEVKEIRKQERRMRKRGFWRTKDKEPVPSDTPAAHQPVTPPPTAGSPGPRPPAPPITPQGTLSPQPEPRPVVPPEGPVASAKTQPPPSPQPPSSVAKPATMPAAMPPLPNSSPTGGNGARPPALPPASAKTGAPAEPNRTSPPAAPVNGQAEQSQAPNIAAKPGNSPESTAQPTPPKLPPGQPPAQKMPPAAGKPPTIPTVSPVARTGGAPPPATPSGDGMSAARPPASPGNGHDKSKPAGKSNGNGTPGNKPQEIYPKMDLSTLPPNLAESLAKLAGIDLNKRGPDPTSDK